MTIPTAESMSQAIGSVFSALDGQNLITNYSLIRTLCGTLKRDRGNSWRINISDAEPITFKTITDKNNKEIVPQIMVDLHVDTTNADFPYLKWLVALELRQLNAQRTPVAKWHFDLASSAQDGPRIHLQCGGHFAGNDVARNMELSLDVPRWHHPAIDLLLLTEIAVANFYKNESKNMIKFKSSYNNFRKRVFFKSNLKKS